MEQLIYIDTNVWIDFWEDRRDNIRPLGEFAFQLLKKAYECKYRIIVSGLVIDELDLFYSKETIIEIMKNLRASGKYQPLKVLEQDRLQAEETAKEVGTSYNDARHAILANRANADYLVTRNLKDFERLFDLNKTVLPENLF